MGLMNKSLLELLGDLGKGIYKGSKYLAKDALYEGTGLLTVGADVAKLLYKKLLSTSSRYFEKTTFKDAENFVQGLFGRKLKKGHLGEKGVLKRVKEYKPVDLGDTFPDGSPVGFIPKVAQAMVNAPVKAITNLPIGVMNNIVLSPGGRLGAGIAGAGVMYGAFKGTAANSLENAEDGRLAGMVNNITSPILEDDEALSKVSVGFNNHGAEGNLVMALHNLRNSGGGY